MITQKIIARTDSLKLDKIISRYGEDSMRQVVFIIVRPDPDSEELIPITIPEDAVGSFRILKPSGNFVIVPMSKSVLASGETAFDVVLPASANTAKGSGYYDIRITSETDKYYFTAQGDFIIDDNIISDEVLEDVSEVNGLIFPDDFLTVEDHVAYIDDDTISTDSTWSSNKINEEIEAHAGGDVSKTVSGNPIEINDAASAPLVKCVTQITGYQSGTGTPSPDNIRPIVAYTEGEIEVRGKNQLDNTATTTTINGVTFTVNADGTVVANGTVTANTSFNVGSFTGRGNYKINGVSNGSVSSYYFQITNYEGTTQLGYFTDGDYDFEVTQDILIRIRAISGAVLNNVKFYPMIRIATETDPTYEPYTSTTHTTTYPSAIYRGSEDCVNGEVTEEWGMITATSTASFANPGIVGAVNNFGRFAMDITDAVKLTNTSMLLCNEFEVIEFSKDESVWLNPSRNCIVIGISAINGRFGIVVQNTAILSDLDSFLTSNPIEIAYELATPTTSSVTPTNLPIKSLSGYTHIESSTGDMEVEYITSEYQPLIDSIAQL